MKHSHTLKEMQDMQVAQWTVMRHPEEQSQGEMMRCKTADHHQMMANTPEKAWTWT